MRIGVLGTCQAQSFAASVAALLPEAEVRHFFLGAATADEVQGFAAASDLFLAQPVAAPEFGDLRTSCLPQHNLVLLPHVVFTGFHPEVTPIVAWGADHSPFSGYHSAIVAACYRMGIAAARVPPLFNCYVYEELGYFAEYKRARDFLVKSCAELGYDVAGLIDRWASTSSFMHTINHPDIGVLFDIVRMSLVRAGLVAPGATAELPADVLVSIRWPVFDCVAERLAIAPEPTFRRFEETMTLLEFAERSYAAYAAADAAELTRVDNIAQAIATFERIGLR